LGWGSRIDDAKASFRIGLEASGVQEIESGSGDRGSQPLLETPNAGFGLFGVGPVLAEPPGVWSVAEGSALLRGGGGWGARRPSMTGLDRVTGLGRKRGW